MQYNVIINKCVIKKCALPTVYAYDYLEGGARHFVLVVIKWVLYADVFLAAAK